MALFNLSYQNNPDFTTLRARAIDVMTNKVIKRLVRRAEPADQNELREAAFRCVAGERQASIEVTVIVIT